MFKNLRFPAFDVSDFAFDTLCPLQQEVRHAVS